MKGTRIIWMVYPYNWEPTLLADDPAAFKPQRWMVTRQDGRPTREVEKDTKPPAPVLSHALLAAPFGGGPRMCVGARVAQSEIHTLVSAICLNFCLSMDPPNQHVEAVQRLVVCPEPAPRIRFEAQMKISELSKFA